MPARPRAAPRRLDPASLAVLAAFALGYALAALNLPFSKLAPSRSRDLSKAEPIELSLTVPAYPLATSQRPRARSRSW